jgi:SET domain
MCDKFASYNLAEPIAKDVWNIVASVPWESRSTNALPRTYEAVMKTADKGIRSLYQPAAQKPFEEIQAQGRCIDNIRHARSTLPDAGRGAFASRPMVTGQVITGSPLLHIPDREFVSMYKIEPDPTNPGGRWKRNLDEKIGHQILLNYCWGHDQTTILLCPYGVGVSYINHNKTKANVKIQWTKDGELSHNASFVDIDPLKLLHDYKVHLAFDYVATRDIKEGEELFLDYGDAWEEAWNDHVANWEPSERWKHYAPAEVWNVKLANTPIRTENEQELDPYPSHILVRAHPLLRKRTYREDFAALDNNPWKITEKGFTCIVRTRRYDRNAMTFVYDVSVDTENEDGVYLHTLELNDVPRNALAFVDVPYSTDIHQRGVFRHELGIPDEMLSDAWKNR